MYKILPILVLLAVGHCQNKNGDLDDVLSSIFGPPPQGTTGKPIQDKNQGSTIVPPITNNNGGDAQQRSSSSELISPNDVENTPPDEGDESTHQDDEDDTHTDNEDDTDAPPNGTEEEEDLSCRMPDGEEGECVSYYLCNVDNNTVITDGVGVIDIRVRDGPCASYIDTCCLVPDKRPPDQPKKPDPKPDEPQRKGCGWANPDGADLRTTGETNGETKFGEFPWMVAILKIEPVNENEPDGQKLNVYVGGGSLIHPSIVITAAHYVASSKALRIRAGEWDTQSTKEIYPYQDRDVASVVTHEDFNDKNLFYDIAVLFLAQPVDLKPHIRVACLPPPKMKAEHGTRCFATGWGKDKFGKEGRYQVILKKIELPVVKRDKCQVALRKTRLGRFFQLHSSFMCAGGEANHDTCKGDGGSPLSCPIAEDKDRYVQAGIVAWGIGCGEDGTPGVYVDVSNLREWIDDKVVGKGYDPQTYTY